MDALLAEHTRRVDGALDGLARQRNALRAGVEEEDNPRAAVQKLIEGTSDLQRHRRRIVTENTKNKELKP